MADGGAGAGRLVAVVVTHDRLAQLRRTVTRLLEAPPERLGAVLVVDNASTDGTADWLAGLSDPRLQVLRNSANLGGAGGFEAGMRAAAARFDPDWMVVMDDDARPAPGALAAFHAADLRGWDAIAAAVRFPDGRICEMNRPWVNPFWHRCAFLRSLRRGRAGFHLETADYAARAPQSVDGASFVGLFLSRAAIARAGFPDARLFIYGEDGLYTLGLSRAGGRIGFFPALRFEHDLTTFAGQRGRFRPLWKSYYYHRNLLLLYRAAAGPLFWPALLLVLPKWAAKARHHEGERRAYLRLLALAVGHGLRRRIGTDHAEILAAAKRRSDCEADGHRC